MSTDFIPIAEAKETCKGSIQAIVVKEGDLKAGTTNGKDWTKRVFTLEDSSGNIELTCWNENISKFKVGYTYQIVNPWWKMYQGQPQLDLGNYAEVTVVESDKAPTEATQEHEPPTPSPKHESPIPIPKDDSHFGFAVPTSIKGQVLGMRAHDHCWAVAIEEAKKVYNVENVQIPDSNKVRDLNLKDRMILAQVYYKKLMDFEIHGAKK